MNTLGAEIDEESEIDIIPASLPESFNQFIMNYNMNKMNVTLSELLNMLIAVESLLKKEKPSVMMVEKPKQDPKLKAKDKSFKRKGSQGPKPKGHDNKENKAKDKAAKENYFHCGKPRHWKRNCLSWHL